MSILFISFWDTYSFQEYFLVSTSDISVNTERKLNVRKTGITKDPDVNVFKDVSAIVDEIIP